MNAPPEVSVFDTRNNTHCRVPLSALERLSFKGMLHGILFLGFKQDHVFPNCEQKWVIDAQNPKFAHLALTNPKPFLMLDPAWFGFKQARSDEWWTEIKSLIALISSLDPSVTVPDILDLCIEHSSLDRSFDGN